MTQSDRAVYENGLLRPLGPLDLNECEEVDLVIALLPAKGNSADNERNAEKAFPVFETPPGARPITLETVHRAAEDIS